MAHQSARDIFVRLEKREGHLFHRREKDAEQEGCEDEHLVIVEEPIRTLTIVEPHVCLHVMGEIDEWPRSSSAARRNVLVLLQV